MRRKSVAVFLVVALAVAGVAGPAFAEQDTGRLVVTKLFRGIANAATGWMEIPKQIMLVHQEMGGGAAFTWGLAKGIGYAIGRSVVGAYEIATFPLPVPEGYEPIMQPEYVLSDLPSEAPKPTR